MDASSSEADLYSISEQDDRGDTLSRQAYLRLRDQIVSLKRGPGSSLPEAALARELQLGRTPSREALQRQACPGLVEIRSRQRAFVADIRLTDLQQIFEVRLQLEVFAAGLAAERATAADMARMEAALAGLGQVDTAGDIPAHIEIDHAFHRALAQSTHNRFLQPIMALLYNLNLRLWYLALERVGPMHAAVEQHCAVLEAIRQRNPRQAQAAMRRHVSEFQERIRAVF